MRVNVRVDPVPGLPPVEGPHELAWSYLLDAIFEDAYHQGVGRLDIRIPTPELESDVTLRGRLSRGEDSSSAAAAFMVGGGIDALPQDADRLYTLGFGALAPVRLRRSAVRVPTGWRSVRRLGVFSLASRLYGVPIRLASAVGRTDVVDRAMAAMRARFAGADVRPVYYELETWSRT